MLFLECYDIVIYRSKHTKLDVHVWLSHSSKYCPYSCTNICHSHNCKICTSSSAHWKQLHLISIFHPDSCSTFCFVLQPIPLFSQDFIKKPCCLGFKQSIIWNNIKDFLKIEIIHVACITIFQYVCKLLQSIQKSQWS